MRPLGRRLVGFWFGLCFGFAQNRSRSRRGGKVGISRFGRDFQGSVGAGGNLLLVFAGPHAPAFSTALFGGFADQLFARAAITAHHVRPVADRDGFIQVFRIVIVLPAKLWRNRVLSICHHRSLMATVLSFSTTRSVCTVKIQFRSLPLVRRNAVPFSAAGTLNWALNSPMYRSRRKALAPSAVVIPASRSSCGKRPCQVPKLRSDRPRACGE